MRMKRLLIYTLILGGLSASNAQLHSFESPDFKIELKQKQAPNLPADSYTIEATVLPENAYNKKVNWSLAWDSDESSDEDNDNFKIGKNVEDYIKITASGIHNHLLTVEALQPFESQAIITATSAQNATLQATTVVNYVRRVQSENNGGSHFFSSDQSINHVYTNVTFTLGSGSKTVHDINNITYKWAPRFFISGKGFSSPEPIEPLESGHHYTIHNYNGTETYDLITLMSNKMAEYTGTYLSLSKISQVLPANGQNDPLKYHIKDFYKWVDIQYKSQWFIHVGFAAFADGVQAVGGVHTATYDGIEYTLVQIDMDKVDKNWLYPPSGLNVSTDFIDL